MDKAEAIVLPTVKEIGDSAFVNNDKLRLIHLGDSGGKTGGKLLYKLSYRVHRIFQTSMQHMGNTLNDYTCLTIRLKIVNR